MDTAIVFFPKLKSLSSIILFLNGIFANCQQGFLEEPVIFEKDQKSVSFFLSLHFLSFMGGYWNPLYWIPTEFCRTLSEYNKIIIAIKISLMILTSSF